MAIFLKTSISSNRSSKSHYRWENFRFYLDKRLSELLKRQAGTKLDERAVTLS